MKTQKSKYRLLVLMDKSAASHNTLKNAVNLAKLIDGNIDVFQVNQQATNLVNSESQTATIRAIQEESINRKKELRDIIDLVSEKEKILVSFNFTYGNIKNEINDHIKKTNPDIIILGKRKKKIVSFLGDGVTKSLLKNYDGTILIAGDEKAFTSYDDKSIGFLNHVEGFEKTTLANDLKKNTKKPFKLFKSKHDTSLNTNEDTIIFEYNESDTTTNGMVNLIADNNLSLLCINKKNEVLTKTLTQTNIPVLILNN